MIPTTNYRIPETIRKDKQIKRESRKVAIVIRDRMIFGEKQIEVARDLMKKYNVERCYG